MSTPAVYLAGQARFVNCAGSCRLSNPVYSPEECCCFARKTCDLFYMLAHLLNWQLNWSSNLLGQMSTDFVLALATSSDC